MISGKGGFTAKESCTWAKAREKVERSGEERESVPVQKPTNEGREYLERCIQVKRGRRNRPREKERWNGRWIKKDRGQEKSERRG